jgi:hypothetical protein
MVKGVRFGCGTTKSATIEKSMRNNHPGECAWFIDLSHTIDNVRIEDARAKAQ